VLLACLLLALAPDHYQRQPAFDVQRYVIDLDVDLEHEQLACASTIEIVLVDPKQAVLRLDYSGPPLAELSVDQHAATYRVEGQQLVIELPEADRADGRLVVASRYRGRPEKGFCFRQNRHGDKVAFTDDWPERARQWLPCIDHPSDRARVDFTVRAPAGLQVVANGAAEPARTEAAGVEVHAFHQDLPIATYLFAVAIAPLVIIDEATAHGAMTPAAPAVHPRWQAFVYPQEREAGRAFGESGDVLTALESIAGPYPFATLDLVQIPTRFGGMENAGCIFLNEMCLQQPARLTSLVAHEVAHQWFGDLIGIADWSELWLSEGFATYGATLVDERMHGAPALVTAMHRSLEALLASENVRTRCIRDRAIVDPETGLNDLSYGKGAFVLHMLRHTIGDDAFFRTLKEHVAQNAGKVVTTEDFRAVAEKVSGLKLDRFFAQWIDRAGYPDLLVSKQLDASGHVLAVTVEQRQPELFECGLEVTLDDRTVTLPIAQRSATFEVKVDAPPEHFACNEQASLLAKIEVK
jgi:aminopeptidase N